MMHPRRFAIPLAVLLMGALAAPAQRAEAEVYFSLSTDRPVRPGETSRVQVRAQGVDRLQFRLYRVNDPVKFFLQLDNPHQFGAAASPRPEIEITPLERFAAWKNRLRTRVRELARRQFSAGSRSAIRAKYLAPKASSLPPSAPGAASEYAAIPLLNPQQVVRVWEQPVRARNRWESVTVPVEVDRAGLYVIEATDGKKQAYTIISATDLAVISKAQAGQVQVRVVRRDTGAPVAGAALLAAVAGTGGKTPPSEAKTDPDGFALIVPEKMEMGQLLLMARHEGDFAVATKGSWGFSRPERELRGYVYSDRPVYRPGHTVHLKSILRDATLRGYSVRRGAAQVQIQNPEGAAVLTRAVTLNEMGTAAVDFEVPAAAPLGYYSVDVRAGEDAVSGGFHVEEYRKPDYEVRVNASQNRLVMGGDNRLTVRARYYYGEPVAGAKLTYAVHRSRYWLPWYDMDELDDSGDGDEYYGGEQVAEGEGRLNADGEFVLPYAVPESEYDQRYRVEARVTDESGREISGAGAFVATRGEFFVYAQAARWVVKPGENAQFDVETRDYDGKFVPNVTFRADLVRYQWDNRQQRPVVASAAGTTGADGRGSISLTPPEGGSYQVRVFARAQSGRQIEGSAWLWVEGSGGWGGMSQRVQIIPDQRSYKPGDKARLLIATGVPESHAWVSIESQGVHWAKFVHLRGPAETIEVPVEANWAPNVFAEVVFIHNDTLYRGSRNLKVPPVEKQIQVAVTSDREQYQPGEPATFQIEAKDHQGRPVEGEFSLGVVDEAIYAVRREAQPDITRVFHGPRWRAVQTDSSLYFYFYGEAGKRRMELVRLSASKAFAQMKPERLVEPKIRKEFPDTAFWAAYLRTNAQGRATARVTFPDSLTTWRATARGITADTKVGQALHRTIVRKNLLLTIAAPRFLTEGDEVTIPVIVRNYLESAAKVRVSMDAPALTLVDGGTKEVEVPSRGEARVDYRYKTPAGLARATLLASALTTKESDAMELTLPVEPDGVKWREVKQGALRGVEPQTAAGAFPADSLPHARSLEIQVTPSVAGALFGALEYLAGYPYGCVEQTMSRFLPSVVVSQAFEALKLPPPENPEELRKKVTAGLDRLYNFQHEDGGWGWWQNDESDGFMTAYVAAGIQQAALAGYRVNAYRVRLASLRLTEMLANPRSDRHPDLPAWQLYALAELGEAKPEQFNAVWSGRERWSPLGWALAGLAAHRMKDGERALEAARKLEALARREGGEAWWTAERDLMLDFDQNATPEATAFALRLLAALGREPELQAAAAQWLVAHRNEGPYWSSTKQTALVVFGLTPYLERSGELNAESALTVTVNGREVLRRRFTKADALWPEPLTVRLTGEEAGARYQVRFEKQGEGRVYWSVREESRRPGGGMVAPEDWKMRVTREYFRMRPERRDGRIVYTMEPLEGPARTGELVAVRLTAQGADQRYVLVEDPIPAGAELVQNDAMYEFGERPRWWSWWGERRELRDNRITYFPTFLPSGGENYTYLMRFTNKGVYRVPPARVEPMYRPGYVSASEAKVIEVQ
ncbi:MAG: alpha-2-macroglobulin [Bryobacteraceae bacterium]|nr:alpha-2-macroglobulin [Bryobacteraceae bacterium]